jgi:hypothetical protein
MYLKSTRFAFVDRLIDFSRDRLIDFFLFFLFFFFFFFFFFLYSEISFRASGNSGAIEFDQERIGTKRRIVLRNTFNKLRQ